MKADKLRTLGSVGEFFHFFGTLFRIMPGLRKIPQEKRISPAFSEKLMLSVTAVNECAYCSWLHSRTALEKGVEQSEIEQILAGETQSFTEDELPAVLYAQHFAETKGQVSADARETFFRLYGQEKAAHAEAFITMVCFGNLCSNTVLTRETQRKEAGHSDIPLGLYLLAKPIAAGIKRRGLANR